MTNSRPTLLDFATVIYSAGRVFDGLSASDVATTSFLRTGSAQGISRKTDLHLLRDLKALAEHVITHAGGAVDADYVIALNAEITASGPLEPGRLRTAGQRIGVGTRYGRHEPPAIASGDLQRLLDRSIGGADAVEDALAVFVNVARAQLFGDGNKRTALFAANALLLNNGAGRTLSVPYDENDPAVSDLFNDLLARAYVFGEDEGVKDLLRARGLQSEEDVIPFVELVSQLRELLGVRLVAYIGGVKSARSVSMWAEGAGQPGEIDRERGRAKGCDFRRTHSDAFVRFGPNYSDADLPPVG